MGKGLIGNSLSFCMQDILKGNVSIDDIDTIYAGTCFTEETIPNLLEEYNYYWEAVAREKAGEEIARQYGVESIWDIDDKEQRAKAMKQEDEKRAEIMPAIKSEARDVFYSLYESGKIVQTRYRIPQGEKEIATYVDFGEEITDHQYEVSSDSNGLMKINGRLYETLSGYNCVYADGQHKWCNNKKEFIASQMGATWSSGNDVRYTKAGMLKLLFPEYEQAITQLCGIMRESYLNRENGKYFFSFDEILEKLDELTQDRGVHTAEEIGDSVKDSVRLEAMQEVLSSMTRDENRDLQQDGQDLDE